MLQHLNQCNSYPVYGIDSDEFRIFGVPVTNYDFSDLIEVVGNEYPVPDIGNQYVPSDERLESFPIFKTLSSNFFGGSPAQIGYNTGNNQKLGAFEFHMGSELLVAVTPIVVFLAPLWKITKDNEIDTSEARAFYLPAGAAVEIFSTTLHYSPCRVSDDGFKSLVILPRGTNFDVDKPAEVTCFRDRLIFKRNKWLLAHASSRGLIEKGALVCVTGENYTVKY